MSSVRLYWTGKKTTMVQKRYLQEYPERVEYLACCTRDAGSVNDGAVLPMKRPFPVNLDEEKRRRGRRRRNRRRRRRRRWRNRRWEKKRCENRDDNQIIGKKINHELERKKEILAVL